MPPKRRRIGNRKGGISFQLSDGTPIDKETALNLIKADRATMEVEFPEPRRNEAWKALRKFVRLYDATKGGTDATSSQAEEVAMAAGDAGEACAQELEDIVTTHDGAGLFFLWGLIYAANTLGSIKSPVAKARLEKRTAHARKSIEAQSRDINKKILELAEQAWKRIPSCRKSAGKTASEIAESLNLYLRWPEPMGQSAIEKRVRKLMRRRTAE
jgi:hypothetical protein